LDRLSSTKPTAVSLPAAGALRSHRRRSRSSFVCCAITPDLVTRDELLNAAWPDCCVSDGTLTSTIWMIRRALRDSDAWIETIPKRGYRFVGAVNSTDSTDSAGHVAPPPRSAETVLNNCYEKGHVNGPAVVDAVLLLVKPLAVT
jgi:hypothetical protein